MPGDEYEQLPDKLEMAEDIAAFDAMKANPGEWVLDVVAALADLAPL